MSKHTPAAGTLVMAGFHDGRSTFHAFGVDKASALTALRDAYARHDVDADLADLDDYTDEVWYAEVSVGVGLRDGAPV